jgi:DNA-directed RNA polymerase specialized sigma subunit
LKFDPYAYNYSYSEWEHIIDEHIFNERNRKILKRKLLDDVTFERIAEEMEMSVRGVQYVVKDGLNELIRHI